MCDVQSFGFSVWVELRSSGSSAGVWATMVDPNGQQSLYDSFEVPKAGAVEAFNAVASAVAHDQEEVLRRATAESH